MKDELAEALVAAVMKWEPEQVREYVPRLQSLASVKYDEYGGYAPGEKFLESLASWLRQFSIEERRVALRFVLDDLIFVSRAELDHTVSLAYPHVIRPMALRVASSRTGIEAYRVATLASTPEFRGFQRRILVLGLSDGARLDRLRRSSLLSHEQFFPAELGDDAAKRALDALCNAVEQLKLGGDCLFEYVLLVDDFYGTGRTLIRTDEGKRKGRLLRVRGHLEQLVSDGVLRADHGTSILVYVASARALEHVRRELADEQISWPIQALQLIPDDAVVIDTGVAALCRSFYDPILTDSHKGEASMGYHGAALPLVLEHNAPNDSISILWADTRGREGGLQKRALFPRYERHHADRP